MARDVLKFLRRWARLYPDLAGNHFWLAGESYAGAALRWRWRPQCCWGRRLRQRHHQIKCCPTALALLRCHPVQATTCPTLRACC